MHTHKWGKIPILSKGPERTSRSMCEFKIHTTSWASIFIFIMNLFAYRPESVQGFSTMKLMKVLWRFLLALQDKVLFPTSWVLGAPQGLNILALLFHYRKGLHVNLLPPQQNYKLLEGRTGKVTVPIHIQMVCCLLFKWLSKWCLWSSVFSTKKMNHHSSWKTKSRDHINRFL